MIRHEAGILQRSPRAFDLSQAQAHFRERTVLITGGAGSIGAELARQLAELGCPRLIILDHFDHALLTVCEQLRETHPQTAVDEVLGDIRDRAQLVRTFTRARPDVVINAAALKHVHLGERHPAECIRTNLLGMRNVLHAAAAAGAGSFVQISTDKAAAPVCVMGASKRLAELHVWSFAREHAGAPEMKIVRFGNVLESQGSVVPRFRQRIAEGRDLEVTHPEMRRFFMSLSEAVQLVTQVSAHPDGEGARAYYLDMGEPVRIVDLARDMLVAAGSSRKIVFTRLREGEKLGEALFDEAEIVAECGLDHCYAIAPLQPDMALSAARLAALEESLPKLEDHQIGGRLFALLDDCLGREERAIG